MTAPTVLSGTQTTAPAGFSTTVVVNIPTGTTTGDQLVAFVSWVGSSNPTCSSSGWTQVAATTTNNTVASGQRAVGWCFTRTADGSEGSTVTFTYSVSSGTRRAATVRLTSGATFDVSAVRMESISGGSGTYALEKITTGHADELILYHITTVDGNNTVPSGTTSVVSWDGQFSKVAQETQTSAGLSTLRNTLSEGTEPVALETTGWYLAGGGDAESVTQVDNIGITDAKVLARGLVRADNVGITDPVAKAFRKVIVDNVGVTDVSLGISYDLIVADNIGITDNANATKSKSVTTANNVGITDSVAKSLNKVRVDNIGITDSTTRTTGNAVGTTDNIGITDSTVIVVTNAFGRVDVVGISDSVARSKAMFRSVSDAIGLTDVVTSGSEPTLRAIIVCDVSGPALRRIVTGPELVAILPDGPARQARSVSGPEVQPRVSTGPETESKVLTGPSNRCA